MFLMCCSSFSTFKQALVLSILFLLCVTASSSDLKDNENPSPNLVLSLPVEGDSSCNPLDALSENGTIHGWVDQPNYRGTMDIIWSCLLTTFICTYTMLHLNVPAVNESTPRIICRRVFWMFIAILGPEIVLAYAAGQWGTAEAGVKSFHDSGYIQWTTAHAFFADMGGFLLVPKDFPPFPVTNRHIIWLVKNGHLKFPDVSPGDIDDKSKQDTIAKVLICFQVLYLVLQCIGRAALGLAITTLELSCIAIVVCSMFISFCWWHKPYDVREPIRLDLDTPIAEILKSVGGAASAPYEQTPLDFIDDLKPSWSLNVQTFMKMPTGPFARPIPRLGNDRFPNLKGYREVTLFVGTLIYAGIHLFGWNYVFPTRLELLLWRISSMFLFGTTVLFWVFHTAAEMYRAGRWQRAIFRIVNPERLEELEKARTAKLQREETWKVTRVQPLPWEFWSIFPLAIAYGIARGYLIVEAFLGLRHLEASAFENVEWANFLPHV